MNVDTLCVSCMEDDSGSPTCPKCGALFQLPHTNFLQLAPRTLLHQQYVIGRALGHGGFGVTYLAWDIGLKIRLAIKEYLPSGVAGRSSPNTVHPCSDRTKDEFEWGLDRFLEEARVLKKFSTHPNIVSVDTIFRDNGTAYMVMEYLEGMTFEEFVARRGGKITFETALRVLVPIMDTLATVHAEGILHRDVSPDNIHIAKSGKVKLMDFGAARNALSQKSRNLSVILKEGYAPEEQYRSSGIQGPWTDVYATAATLYHSITGKLPPPALDRAAEDNLEIPSKLGVAIPANSERGLIKALAVRAMDRFQSMEDFKGALTDGVSAAPPTEPSGIRPSSVPVAGPSQPPPMPTQGSAAPPPQLWSPPVAPTHPSLNPPANPAPNPPTNPTPPQFQSPPPQPSYAAPTQQGFAMPPMPPPTAPSGSSSRKWLIPVLVVVLVALGGAAVVTIKYGPDLLSRFSTKEDAADKDAPAPNPPATDQPNPAGSLPASSPPAGSPQADSLPAGAPQASSPPAGSPQVKSPQASSPQAGSLPAGSAQTDEERQRRLEQQKQSSADQPSQPSAQHADPAPASEPPPAAKSVAPVKPAAPRSPTFGMLRYSGPPVPYNGRVTFENLPAARLKFTFDHDSWQPIISRQPNGTQTLVLVSLKRGLQSKCDVRWEMVP